MVILTSFQPPSEGVRLKQTQTTAHIQDKELGSGTLFIAESRLSWVSDDEEGFSLEYPGISLHAVSRDLSAFPHPCLYLMIDGKLQEKQNGESSDSEGEDDSPFTEVRFVPSDPQALDVMFNVMSDCQALHPDEEQESLSEGEMDEEYDELAGGEGGLYTSPDDEVALTAQGRATLQRLENLMMSDGEQQPGGLLPNGSAGDQMDTEQFEDADT